MPNLILPSQLRFDTVINGPASPDWLWDLQQETIRIAAERPITNADPTALAALAAWADFQRARGIVLNIDDSVKSPYAWRFGLLSALAGRFVTSLPKVPNYLPPAQVRVDADKTAVLRDIAPLLHLTAPDQQSVVYQCLSEILRNVVEHANSYRGAFVCCSHYPAADRVHIAVVDTGVGVPATICRKYGALTDKQAIEAAIQWRVTGAIDVNPFGGSVGVSNNAGIGLYYVRSAATHTNGTFSLASRGVTPS